MITNSIGYLRVTVCDNQNSKLIDTSIGFGSVVTNQNSNPSGVLSAAGVPSLIKS